MKLKDFMLVGYLLSTVTVVVAVIWAVNRMLIVQQEAYFIIAATIGASAFGFLVSWLLLGKVFYSLDRLKMVIKNIPNKQFEKVTDIQTPVEFKELADAFNEMTIELEETFQSLAESEQEKGMMIAQLSHDIRTPITSIQAMVEGMLDGVIAPEETTDYLQTIRRQTERLNDLVEQLNTITLNARQQATALSLEPILLDKLLIDILSEFQYKIDQEKRTLHIDVEASSVKFYSDVHKLSRILLNLVSNALKYSKAGTPLYIRTYKQDQHIIIEIQDEGQGIPSEELENIFKRLYRVEVSRNMETGGHGLGLYIARELARQLGGDITVTSVAGKGSTFSVILPTSSAQ